MLKALHIYDEALMVWSKALCDASTPGYIPPQRRAVTQLRSDGVKIFAATQSLEIDDLYKDNATTVAVMCCPNPKEAREAAAMLGAPAELALEIQNLPVGVALVRSAGFRRHVKVSIPNFDLGPYPSNAEIARRMASEFAWLEQNTIYSPATKSGDAPAFSYLETLGEAVQGAQEEDPAADLDPGKFFAEHRTLLQEILNNPDDSVTEHYRRLNWSAGRGNRVKKQLLEMGLARTDREKSENGRPREILTISEKGRKALRNENQ
jgi:DNA-binding MarR family transcriptional regulator